MPDHRPRRKRIRLPQVAYSEIGAVCSITIAVKARVPVFANAAVALGVVEVLRERASTTGTRVYAYCVMPDHVHLVLGVAAGCDLVTFVGQFKNLAQRMAWSRGVVGAFWQTSFWDHFVRAEEELEEVVRYVLENPVRAGLVERWQDYGFSGSLVLNVRDE